MVKLKPVLMSIAHLLFPSNFVAMNTLLRAASSSIRPRFDHYEPLNEVNNEEDDDSRWRTFSKRKREISTQFGTNMMTNSMSYRSFRARKRLIFLKSYKLGSVKRPATASKKVKKVFSKVKALVISAVALARIGIIKSGNCRSAIDASSPIPVRKGSFYG